MYTGSEKAHPFCELARPAPRGHKPPVRRRRRRRWVRGRAGARAVRPARGRGPLRHRRDGAGRRRRATVVGATWKRYAETGAVRAGAVVVAAGGFVMNEEMIAAYAPRLQALVARGMALGNSFDDGLGIRLGESVGGVAEHMEGAFFTSPFYPPGDTLKGIVVNKAGRAVRQRGRLPLAHRPRRSSSSPVRRATSSSTAPRWSSRRTASSPSSTAGRRWRRWRPASACPRGRWWRRCATTTSTRRRATTRRSTRRRSGWCRSTRARGAPTTSRRARRSTPGSRWAGCGSRWTARCCAADGSPVPGCTPPGAAAANIALDGAGYSSGTQLGEASYFGRRAGRHAAGA